MSKLSAWLDALVTKRAALQSGHNVDVLADEMLCGAPHLALRSSIMDVMVLNLTACLDKASISKTAPLTCHSIQSTVLAASGD